MKTLILSLISILSIVSLTAQEDAITSQYLVNPYFINPGAAGINGMHNFHAAYRSSLNTLPNHPNTYYASYNGMVGKKVAMGALLLNDQLASINKYKMQLSYAYSWMSNENTHMGLGLNAEFHQINLDKDVLNNGHQQGGDQTIMDAVDGAQYFDATVGLYGIYKGKLSFGLTLPNLVRARLNKGEDEEIDPFSTALKNFTATVGYRFDVKDYEFGIEPSVMVRKNYTSPIITDVNLKAYFLKNRLVAGGTLRIIDSETLMAVLMGVKLGALRVYYSYDISFQNSQKYHGGSHEFTVNFELSGKKKMTPEEEAKAKEAAQTPPANNLNEMEKKSEPMPEKKN